MWTTSAPFSSADLAEFPLVKRAVKKDGGNN